MPNPKNDRIEKTARLIFKNSKHTVNSYSRTYSGTSQVYTKSLILRLKQNLPNAEYYEDNGTVKRDLSVETDICILRGYYKKRRSKFINRETVSAKSKYSVNHTEIDTIDEYKFDSSACGDSKGSLKLNNTHFNVNLTSLVVQNLKKLLNDWVKKYLLDSDETKEKIETVLDSILHKLDLQTKETVSSCTYTVDIEILDEKQNQISKPVKPQAVRHGSLSVPLCGQSFRILSTLSVPRNINRSKISKCSYKKLNKIRHKKIHLSNNASSKYLFTSSSLNFLTLPTKLLTRYCATYTQDLTGMTTKNQQKSLILPEELYDADSLDSFIAIARNSALNAIPSIYKNIYKGVQRRAIPSSKTNNVNSKNEHEESKRKPLESIDLINQNFLSVDNAKVVPEEVQDRQVTSPDVESNIKQISRKSKKSISRMRKHKSIKSKRFTYYFKKSKPHTQQEKELLYHFQSIFNMISSRKGGEDVKLDIYINVFPCSDSEAGKKILKNCEYSDPLASPELSTGTDPQTTNNDIAPNIIPLLDGAVSQAKYITSGNTPAVSIENSNFIDSKVNNCIIKDSQIVEEISELKTIIKSLASTTEKLVNEHLTKKNTKTVILNTQIDKDKEVVKDIKKEILTNPSKGVQISNGIIIGEGISSGIKLKKNPKKKRRNYNPRLIKRSTSYNIIDSESILEVTDMTSAKLNVGKDRADKALTCSLPTTKSLFEVSCMKCDEKLSAIHCNNAVKPREYVFNVCERKNKPPPVNKNHAKTPINETKNKTDSKCDIIKTDGSDERSDGNLSTSIIIDIETKTRGKKITVHPRTGIRFCEGCCYCILLWIPVFIILWLFHEYVLKYYIPEKYSLSNLIWSKTDYINESYLRLTLADLGF